MLKYVCIYRNDRYDDLRACLGEGLLQELQQQHLFMVGTGWNVFVLNLFIRLAVELLVVSC